MSSTILSKFVCNFKIQEPLRSLSRDLTQQEREPVLNPTGFEPNHPTLSSHEPKSEPNQFHFILLNRTDTGPFFCEKIGSVRTSSNRFAFFYVMR